MCWGSTPHFCNCEKEPLGDKVGSSVEDADFPVHHVGDAECLPFALEVERGLRM